MDHSMHHLFFLFLNIYLFLHPNLRFHSPLSTPLNCFSSDKSGCYMDTSHMHHLLSYIFLDYIYLSRLAEGSN